jgi:hypothetical protein
MQHLGRVHLSSASMSGIHFEHKFVVSIAELAELADASNEADSFISVYSGRSGLGFSSGCALVEVTYRESRSAPTRVRQSTAPSLAHR